MLGIRFRCRQGIIFALEFYQNDNSLSVGTCDGGKGRRQNGYRALNTLHTIHIGNVAKFQQQDSVESLHLQVVVFVFDEFSSGIDVYPFWQILVTFIVVAKIRNAFAEVGDSQFAIIPCESFHQLLHRLVVYEKLVFIICMYDSYLHCISG